jgi:hypothetical protein
MFMGDCKKKGLPYPSKCWPNDKDFLDGATELRLPSEKVLKAYWDADIIDTHGVKPGTIIAVTDPFVVRFRVELVGDLWHCIHGDWCFDLCFTAIGDGTNFDLSDKLPAGVLDIKGWDGCKDLCVERDYTVPARTIPADHCGTLYEVGAKFSLHCCDRDRPILVGYEALEEREFY